MNDCKIEVKKESSEQSDELAKAFIIGMAFGFAKKYDEIDKVMEEVKKAVTPKPKIGHWMVLDEKSAICSCCYRINTLYGNFCTWCGEKLFEPQESEDAE